MKQNSLKCETTGKEHDSIQHQSSLVVVLYDKKIQLQLVRVCVLLCFKDNK